MLPKEQVQLLDMTVGEGMKLIISGGAVVPPFPIEDKAQTTLKIENPTEEHILES